jgi:hypothetical protein
MNNIEKAKKIINETKTALVKYVISENISKGEKLSFMKFIKESSNYNILHFAAKGSFPQNKTTPIKSLLESAIIIQNKNILRETFDYDTMISDINSHIETIKTNTSDAFEALKSDSHDFHKKHPIITTLKGITGTALILYLIAKREAAKQAKQAVKNEPAKAAAIMKAGIKNARVAKINALKQKSTLCDKTKDPQKCKKVVLDIIKKEKAKK